MTSKDSSKIVHLCVNKDVEGHPSNKEAVFFCMLEKVYLCEKCNMEQGHQEYTDYIKNHLAT